MKLNVLYRKVIAKGIEADIRSRGEIDKLLKQKKKGYEKLTPKEQECFDLDSLFNPFADTRILEGDPESSVKSMIVGIDVDGSDLLLVDKLKDKGKKIDLIVSHHPQGRAYARFYEVMDLQIDIFARAGIPVSVSENLLGERKRQVARRVSSANHARAVDTAKLLKQNFLCIHTPADNCAYQYLRKEVDKLKPASLGQIMDLLLAVPEYVDAARNNNPPQIAVGNRNSRCKKIYLEFTGGTEGPQNIYEKLSSRGIDTIIAMHQSEEHFKKCKKANINVIFASHIASDALGLNILLDSLEKKEKFKIYEFSGFRRFKRTR